MCSSLRGVFPYVASVGSDQSQAAQSGARCANACAVETCRNDRCAMSTDTGSDPNGWRKVKAHISTIITSGQTQLRQKITNIRRSNIVVEATEWANVPFHMQGRLSLNTNEMINHRLQLRRDPEIVRVLEVWWACAQNTQNAHQQHGSCQWLRVKTSSSSGQRLVD